MARYDEIGIGYAAARREDPRIARLVRDVLGDARSVVNVGAGAGSYEPTDRHVIAIEPSHVMAAQRPDSLPPAVRASAGRLPLHDRSVDAALAIMTVHHWDDEHEDGVRELRRVSRGPVAILTLDTSVGNRMWLPRDYLPELAELDAACFPDVDLLRDWLGDAAVHVVPLARDTPDHMLCSFWAHPERIFDRAARAATSGLSRIPAPAVERAMAAIRSDLDDGTWHAVNGYLDTLDEYDVGLRLVVAGGAVVPMGEGPGRG